MNKLAFLILEGLKNVWRHKLTVFTSVTSVFLTLMIIGSLFITIDNSNSLIKYLRSKYKIEVFFKKEMGDKESKMILNEIRNISGVRNATYISSNDAIRIFKDQFEEDIHEMLGYNPLPSSAVVNIIDTGQEEFSVEPIIRSIKNISGIDTVKYQGRLIQRIERFYQKFLNAFIIVAGVIIVITIFIISSTIRLTIYARTEMIKTLKLIGATNLFIKTPFLLEGMFHGLFGALLATGTLIGLVHTGNLYINKIITFQINYQHTTTFWLIGISVVISLIGSYRAVSKII
ncbi:MAG: hypothetical protein H8E64_08245 [Candidatus Marinimicrobia bacterium]|nr:hypothetical protein [Candidatus Neomarinimicrobiota bacterium]